MSEQDVYQKIAAERKRQDEKWGADRDLHDYEWLRILMEEIGEIAKSMEPTDETFLMTDPELVQVAAVAATWYDARQRRCQGEECRYVRHLSDCAVHSEPAMPAGPCDCVERRERPKCEYCPHAEDCNVHNRRGSPSGPCDCEVRLK